MVRVSAIGLANMLATGFTRVFLKYQSFAGLPLIFWIKMFFVTTGDARLGRRARDLFQDQSRRSRRRLAPRHPRPDLRHVIHARRNLRGVCVSLTDALLLHAFDVG